MIGFYPDEKQIIGLIQRGEWAQVDQVRVFVNI